MKNERNLTDLSIREMQAYAAACLASFCAAKGVYSKSLVQLIEHTTSLLVAVDLPKWEQLGAHLELTGRGDPLPVDFKSILAIEEDVTIQRLVELVVEVGIVDMYGSETDFPRRFLNEIITILKSHNVDIPEIDKIFPSRADMTAVSGWGETYTNEEFQFVQKACLNRLGGSVN